MKKGILKLAIESFFHIKQDLSWKTGTQIEKTKHHIVPESQKSTRYVKNGKKRLVFGFILYNKTRLLLNYVNWKGNVS